MSATTLTREARRPVPRLNIGRARATHRISVAITVVALTILAALLRFHGIGHQGFWFDEANTAQLAHFPPGQMLTLIKHYESTPPLFYCVAWVCAPRLVSRALTTTTLGRDLLVAQR